MAAESKLVAMTDRIRRDVEVIPPTQSVNHLPKMGVTSFFSEFVNETGITMQMPAKVVLLTYDAADNLMPDASGFGNVYHETCKNRNNYNVRMPRPSGSMFLCEDICMAHGCNTFVFVCTADGTSAAKAKAKGKRPIKQTNTPSSKRKRVEQEYSKEYSKEYSSDTTETDTGMDQLALVASMELKRTNRRAAGRDSDLTNFADDAGTSAAAAANGASPAPATAPATSANGTAPTPADADVQTPIMTNYACVMCLILLCAKLNENDKLRLETAVDVCMAYSKLGSSELAISIDMIAAITNAVYLSDLQSSLWSNVSNYVMASIDRCAANMNARSESVAKSVCTLSKILTTLHTFHA